MVVLLGLALKAAAAATMILADPTATLSGARESWPNAIPSISCVVLLIAGLGLLLDAATGRSEIRLVWPLAGLWVAGAAAFADRPLDIAEWHWAGSPWAVWAFYALSLPVLRSEWRHRRARRACCPAARRR